jgi:cytochrome c oxidase cbb3-type subunit 2
MFERKSGVLLLAGIGFFALAFLSNGLVPWLMYSKFPEKTVEETIESQLSVPNADDITDLAKLKVHRVTVLTQFKLLAELYRESFEKTYGDDSKRWSDGRWVNQAANTIRLGHKVYVAEGCWHCHSQFIRPVSNEEKRWGPVSKSWEYQNELQRPVMFGTRRVGPDLSREGGRRSNDWHAAHFYRPRDTSPLSVMPDYPWLFDGDAGRPNERGFGIILYMQWLGSWQPTYPDYGQH